MTAISKAIELSGLDKSKSEVLTTKFSSMVEQIEEWKQKANQLIITDSSQKDEIDQAKQGYKYIKSVRIDIEKTRKQLKEDSLKEGKAIDLIAKSLTDEVAPLESQLEEKAKFVELQEAKIKAQRTQERLEKIASLNYAIPQNSLIADMQDEMFDSYYSGLVMQAEKAEADTLAVEQSRIEAEQKAEFERKEKAEAEAEARELQRIENERLKIEAEKREAEIAQERRQAEAERVKQEAIQAEIRAKAEKERKEVEAKNARIQAQKDEEIRIEKEKSEKLQAEIRAKAEKEEAERLANIAKEREALNAPDKEKLEMYLTDLLNVPMPVLDSEEFEGLIWIVRNKIEKACEEMKNQLSKL